MILQALTDYYERRLTLQDGTTPPPGYSLERMSFVVVVDEGGTLIQVDDIRIQERGKTVAPRCMVPMAVKRSSGIAPNLMWDNAAYAMGIDTKGTPARTAKQHAAFVARVEELLHACDDIGVRAVARWLSRRAGDGNHAEKARIEERARILGDRISAGDNLSFKLAGDLSPMVCQRPAVVAAVQRMARATDEDGTTTHCIITGQRDRSTRLHPAIKGVWGTPATGASLISYNEPAFETYAAVQGDNAPIGVQAAGAYATALNTLLRSRGGHASQCLQVGDASTVFWAERPGHPLEQTFASLFAVPPKDDPAQGTQAVRALYQAVHTGAYTPEDRTTRFYVLGLTANRARLSVRFWYVATISALSTHIQQHFDDIAIVRPRYDPEIPSLFRLLTSLAVLEKVENLLPNLAADVFHTILTGLPYPQTLLQTAVRRNRAEQDVTPNRAAIIKASLNRLWRYRAGDMSIAPSGGADGNRQMGGKEITVALDPTRLDTGYRLGRLFAVLEKLQGEAQGSINRTMSTTYFGAASSTPRLVFGTLMRLHQHHMHKLEAERPGRAVYFRRLLGEVMSGIDTYPPHLDLEGQGLFAVGYYHQQQAFYAGAPVREAWVNGNQAEEENDASYSAAV